MSHADVSTNNTYITIKMLFVINILSVLLIILLFGSLLYVLRPYIFQYVVDICNKTQIVGNYSEQVYEEEKMSMAHDGLYGNLPRSDINEGYLLDRAKELQNSDPQKSTLYYLAALEKSKTKKVILEQYLLWQRSIIDTALQKGEIGSALEGQRNIVEMVSSWLYRGTEDDLSSYDMFQTAIREIGQEIAQHQSDMLDSQKAALDSIRQELAKPFHEVRLDAYESMWDQVDEMIVLPELEDEREELLRSLERQTANAQAVLSCSNKDTHVLIPQDIHPDVVLAWLNAFYERFAQESASERNEEPWIEIQEYITLLQQTYHDRTDIQNGLNNMGTIIRFMEASRWQEKAKTAMEKISDERISTEKKLQFYMQIMGIGEQLAEEFTEAKNTMRQLAQTCLDLQASLLNHKLQKIIQDGSKSDDMDFLLQQISQYRYEASSLIMQMRQSEIQWGTFPDSTDLKKSIQSTFDLASETLAAFKLLAQAQHLDHHRHAVEAYYRAVGYAVNLASEFYKIAKEQSKGKGFGYGRATFASMDNSDSQQNLLRAHHILTKINIMGMEEIFEGMEKRKDSYTEIKEDIEDDLNDESKKLIAGGSSCPQSVRIEEGIVSVERYELMEYSKLEQLLKSTDSVIFNNSNALTYTNLQQQIK